MGESMGHSRGNGNLNIEFHSYGYPHQTAGMTETRWRFTVVGMDTRLVP